MPPYQPPYYGWYTAANTNSVVVHTASTLWPQQPYYNNEPHSEWAQAKAKADIKAQPDDEFSWLRRRVREVEERAFA